MRFLFVNQLNYKYNNLKRGLEMQSTYELKTVIILFQNNTITLLILDSARIDQFSCQFERSREPYKKISK